MRSSFKKSENVGQFSGQICPYHIEGVNGLFQVERNQRLECVQI